VDRQNVDRQFDRRKLTIMFGALATVPVVALVAAPAGIAQDASPEASPDASPEASPGASPVAGDQVEIVSHDIFFEPKEVSIPADTDVTIMLPNEGVTLHNFSITEHENEDLPFDPIDIDIDPGATEQVTINAPAGEYYFYCNVPGHEAAGMWGTLTVE
jgi:nitrite reductase (NO-forming)